MWERIIRRSTSSIPSQRYATVNELVRAIRKRHEINIVIFLLILLVCAILFSVGWGAWVSARRQIKHNTSFTTPRIGVSTPQVVEHVIAQSNASLTNRGQKYNDSEDVKRQSLPNRMGPSNQNGSTAHSSLRFLKFSGSQTNLHPGTWFAPQHDD